MGNSAHLWLLFVVMHHFIVSQPPEISLNGPKTSMYDANLVVDGLQIPWGMAFLPDGSLLVTEKSGNIFLVEDGEKTAISHVPNVYRRGQGGLLDIAVDPHFKDNRSIYISYAVADGTGKGGNTAIMRATLIGKKLTNKQLLYKAKPNTSRGQHFGSRLEFGIDGCLYFSVGDRGNRDENPQDITKDGGKIYRIHPDGSIPEDNPFTDEKGAKTAIYSYGHRNPQGLAVHPGTGALWSHEHGPRGGDELNIITKGKNYGWPMITYGINYSGTKITDNTEMPGMEQPLYQWTPSIAPCGMAFVTSDIYPEWKGSLLVGSLSFQYLERVVMEGSTVVGREKLMEGYGRIRNVKQEPDGFVYVAVEGKGIYRLEPR